MKKIAILLVVILAVYSSMAQITDSSSAARYIKVELTKIQYVFDGEIINVDLYAGDSAGNRLDTTTIVWNNSLRQYEFPKLIDGGGPYGYSIATVKVCQVYKGGKSVNDTMRILTRNRYTYFAWGYNTSGNLIRIRHVFHNDMCFGSVREAFFTPGMEGTKQVFFAYNHSYSALPSYLKILSIIGGISFHVTRYDPNSDDPGDLVMAGSLGMLQNIHPLFYSRQEIYDFLKSIPMLRLDVNSTKTCNTNSLEIKRKAKNKREVKSD